MDRIKNSNILFLCTELSTYYDSIIKELYKLGANKVIYVKIPTIKSSFRETNKYNFNYIDFFKTCYNYLINPKERHKWTERLYESLKREKIDVVLSIADAPFESFFIDKMKMLNSDIKFCLFLWDKLNVRHVPIKLISRFDRKFSFDKDDCRLVEGLEYFPDFYVDSKMEIEAKYIYDVSYIGTFSEYQRGVVIKALSNFCKSNNLHSFLYLAKKKRHRNPKNLLMKLYNKFLEREYNKLVGDFINEDFFKTEKISLDEVEQIQKGSNCIVDTSYKNRQGLTLNAIAALAMGKKLITSNNRIVEEEFYHPDNIYIYNPDNPQFDINFFYTPSKPIDFSYLRLDNWLRHIVNG